MPARNYLRSLGINSLDAIERQVKRMGNETGQWVINFYPTGGIRHPMSLYLVSEEEARQGFVEAFDSELAPLDFTYCEVSILARREQPGQPRLLAIWEIRGKAGELMGEAHLEHYGPHTPQALYWELAHGAIQHIKAEKGYLAERINSTPT